MKPVGVRLHRADGTVLNCELIDQGVDEHGMHNWAIANAQYLPGDNVTIEELPGRTSIGFVARVPPGTRSVKATLKGRKRKRRRER